MADIAFGLYTILHNSPTYIDSPLGFQAWVQGSLFVLCIYHFLLYFQNKNKSFLYYSSFVCCLLVSFIHYGPEMFYLRWLPEEHLNIQYAAEFLAYFFAIAFGRTLLEIKKHLPKWDKVLYIGQIVLLFIFVPVGLFIPVFITDLALQIHIICIFVSVLTVYSILLSIILYCYLRSIPTILCIIGSLFFTISSEVTFFAVENILFKGILPPSSSYVYLESGAVLKSLFLALAIGYRVYEIEQDKKQMQLELLQKSVEASTLKAEASEAKIIAFKAQMNPHFIFNALNSINTFILNHDTEKASEYLIDFSKLIRRILKNSAEIAIPLAEEIKTLKKYIKLEQMRTKHGFSFVYHCDPHYSLSEIYVPPLCLQPYVENAIWHGLQEDNKEKKLQLSIQITSDTVQIKIEDNGLGLQASPVTNPNNPTKSFGIKIAKERIEAMDNNASVMTKDRFDSHQNVCGTEVIISLSKQLHTALP